MSSDPQASDAKPSTAERVVTLVGSAMGILALSLQIAEFFVERREVIGIEFEKTFVSPDSQLSQITRRSVRALFHDHRSGELVSANLPVVPVIRVSVTNFGEREVYLRELVVNNSRVPSSGIPLHSDRMDPINIHPGDIKHFSLRIDTLPHFQPTQTYRIAAQTTREVHVATRYTDVRFPELVLWRDEVPPGIGTD